LSAVVLATAKNSPIIAVLAIGGGVVYAATMIFVGRPLFKLFDRAGVQDNGVRIGTLTMLLLVLMLCAWFTDVVGIYSVFGAFIVGVVMPRGQFVNKTCQLIEYLNVALLLPIFFVYSGLNTQIGLLVQPSLFWVTIVTVIVAFVCKRSLFVCYLLGWRKLERSSVDRCVNERSRSDGVNSDQHWFRKWLDLSGTVYYIGAYGNPYNICSITTVQSLVRTKKESG
jgi:Kef-type K+ transport system membrane component KefB